MNEFITVKAEATGEYSEKHSRFLGFIVPAAGEEQATAAINAKRKEYWDARHVVYAYVLSDGTARFSDDGEPHGTAGKPVLEVLKSSGIKNAVIIVARYFGGILLGTGGLVRAYTAAAAQAAANCEKVRTLAGNRYTVTTGYGEYDKLLFILKELGAAVEKSDFSDNVSIEFSLKEEMCDECLKRISDAFSSSVLPKFEGKTEIYEKI